LSHHARPRGSRTLSRLHRSDSVRLPKSPVIDAAYDDMQVLMSAAGAADCSSRALSFDERRPWRSMGHHTSPLKGVHGRLRVCRTTDVELRAHQLHATFTIEETSALA
jgi:hypothetical protein